MPCSFIEGKSGISPGGGGASVSSAVLEASSSDVSVLRRGGKKDIFLLPKLLNLTGLSELR